MNGKVFDIALALFVLVLLAHAMIDVEVEEFRGHNVVFAIDVPRKELKPDISVPEWKLREHSDRTKRIIDEEQRRILEACAPRVAADTMGRIVAIESGWDPFAIGINNKQGTPRVRLSRPPETREEAIRAANQLIAMGKNIDMGLSQINSAHLASRQWSVEDLFDPCSNLGKGEIILREAYARTNDQGADIQRRLAVAFSYYNTGTPVKGLTNGYVNKIFLAPPPATPTTTTMKGNAP